MHPAIHATTRIPGPSTVEPVVNECRNPMSPLASAARTPFSVTSAPRFTRSSNGLFASSVGPAAGGRSAMQRSMECSIDNVQLLLACQPHKLDSVPGDANGEVRILLRMIHGEIGRA